MLRTKNKNKRRLGAKEDTVRVTEGECLRWRRRRSLGTRRAWFGLEAGSVGRGAEPSRGSADGARLQKAEDYTQLLQEI